jgi:hypothetical protein
VLSSIARLPVDFVFQGDSENSGAFLGLRAGTMGPRFPHSPPIAPEEQHNERQTANPFMFD